MAGRVRVSALIPAWNAEASVGRVVEGILSQGEAVREVLVALDGCTDRTGEAARKAGARVLDLGGRQGICAARNTLAREASEEVLWFVDSDSIPEAGCLERLIRGLEEHPDAGLVHGTNVLPEGRRDLPNVAYAILGRHHFLRTTGPRYTSHVTTANCLVRREVLERAGAFQHFRCGGEVLDFYEDLDLSLRAGRLGWKCWFEPAALTWHENPRRSVSAFLRHRVKCGICSTLVRRKHPDLASFGAFYRGDPLLLLPLAPALALYSALKALAVHLKYAEMPRSLVLRAAPLVLLGQAWFTKGVVRAVRLSARGECTVETPGPVRPGGGGGPS